jgi:hypothetical protein
MVYMREALRKATRMGLPELCCDYEYEFEVVDHVPYLML